MFKSLIMIAMATAVSFSAQASQTRSIKKMTNPAAQEFLAAAQKGDDQFSANNAYKIVSVTEGAKGESQDDTDIRLLKSLWHRDYPITGDDGGYNVSKAESMDELLKLENNNNLSDNADNIHAALKEALKAGLSVYIADGTGNNTSAIIWAVVDHKNHEVIYYIESNFGSDC